jgi:hypothetical protein
MIPCHKHAKHSPVVPCRASVEGKPFLADEDPHRYTIVFRSDHDGAVIRFGFAGSALHRLNRILNRTLHPNTCVCCGEPIDEPTLDSSICTSCAAQLHAEESPF